MRYIMNNVINPVWSYSATCLLVSSAQTLQLSRRDFLNTSSTSFSRHGFHFQFNCRGKDSRNRPIESSIRLILQVDFQMCVYTSPALDLLYFLSTSPSPDVIENKRGVLLNEYLDTLSGTMKQLGCTTQPPTMEELKAILKRRAGYGMVSAFSVLPIVMCDKTEVKDLDEIMGKDTFVNPGLKGENYKKVMMKRLPLYDEWGLLDL